MVDTAAVKITIDEEQIKLRMREFLAQAWDEGWRDCAQVGPDDLVIGDNPYRSNAD